MHKRVQHEYGVVTERISIKWKLNDFKDPSIPVRFVAYPYYIYTVHGSATDAKVHSIRSNGDIRIRKNGRTLIFNLTEHSSRSISEHTRYEYGTDTVRTRTNNKRFHTLTAAVTVFCQRCYRLIKKYSSIIGNIKNQ